MSVLSDLFTDIAGAIRGKTGEEGTMKPIDFPSKIESISVGGGGSSELVGYVTFMNGEEELCTMPFIKGYDCPDPITEGLIETPTKETTVSTIYTYSGWDNDLSDLTEDVIVNATYEESTRYYTVTFYDEDGTTVLNTMQVAYGETPSYTPSKTGYTFNGWTTEVVPVTGDTSYIASWQAAVYFASSDWAAIAAVSEAGEAEQYFNVGDSRTETITINGVSYIAVFKIIGFNHDELSDGSGKAGMTIAMFQFPSKITMYYHSSIVSSSGDKTGRSYANSEYKSYVDHVKSYFSTSLQNVIKEVNKDISYINNTANSLCQCELFPLSTIEAGMTKAINYKSTSKHIGTCYELFDKYSNYGNKDNSYTRICLTEAPTVYTSLKVVFRDAYNASSTMMYYPHFSCSNNTFYAGTYDLPANNNVAGLAFCI